MLYTVVWVAVFTTCPWEQHRELKLWCVLAVVCTFCTHVRFVCVGVLFVGMYNVIAWLFGWMDRCTVCKCAQFVRSLISFVSTCSLHAVLFVCAVHSLQCMLNLSMSQSRRHGFAACTKKTSKEVVPKRDLCQFSGPKLHSNTRHIEAPQVRVLRV